MPPMTAADMLDAIALLRAFIRKDEEAQRSICENGDVGAMLTGVCSTFVGLIARNRSQEPILDAHLSDLAERWLKLVTPK